MSELPPLAPEDFTLTLEQELLLAKINLLRENPLTTKEELIDYLTDVTKQLMITRNILKNKLQVK